jgi:predicted outer membrane repeat protein
VATHTGGGIFSGGGTATLTDVTLSGNSASDGGGMNVVDSTVTQTNVTLDRNTASEDGGAINIQNGTVTLSQVTLSGNAAEYGAGINIEAGLLNLTNVTLSGNSARLVGGGLMHRGGPARLTNVTFARNAALTSGGGIWHYGSAGETLRLKNVLLRHGAGGENCYAAVGAVAAITSDGFNLSSDATCTAYLNQAGDITNVAPNLGPLADNGGPTRTHMLMAGSPAIDAGECVDSVLTDQRGRPRVVGPSCDMGAVERGPGDGQFRAYLPALLRR